MKRTNGKKNLTKMEKITRVVVWLMLVAMLGATLIASGVAIWGYLNT